MADILAAPAGLLLAAAGLMAVPMYLSWPLGWDQGIYAWIGEVIRGGGLPFKDGWDVKGPTTHYAYALANLSFGATPLGVRLADLGASVAGAIASFRLLARLAGRRTATIGGLIIFLNYLAVGFWDTAQPDAWIGWLLVGMTLILTREAAPGRWRTFAVGILAGIATLTKPVYTCLLALPLAAEMLRDRRPRPTLASIVPASAGFVAALIVCLAWFAAHGALSDLLDGYVAGNWEAFRAGMQRVSLWRALRHTPRLTSLLLMATSLGGVGWYLGGRARDWRVHVVGTAVVLAAIAVGLQGKYFGYHFQALYPILGVLGAIGLRRLADRPGRRWVGWGVPALTAALAVVSIFPLVAAERNWLAYAFGGLSRAEYLGLYHSDGPGFSALNDERAADYVRSHTEPHDFVLVWGEPLVNFLSGRPTPSRFVDPGPLLGPRRVEYQPTFLADLARHRPALVLIHPFAIDRSYLPQRFPAFLEFLRSGYQEDGSSGSYRVFRMREASARSLSLD